MYQHWDDEAIPSAMLGFAFDNTGYEAIETACIEAYKKLAPILYLQKTELSAHGCFSVL